MSRRYLALALALRYLALALALSTLSCETKSTPPALAASPSAAAATPKASSAAAGVPSVLVARALVAGYGGVGPATPAPLPNLWVVLLIDVEATAQLLGVKLADLELLDKAGKVVARGKLSAKSLRRDDKTLPDEARRKGDFSQLGTMPFNGVIVPGRSVRLHVRAPLDTRSEALGTQPVRFRIRILAKSDAGIRVEGPLQPPWPTG
ncbi:MAG TPA: hypothetical protein PKA88_08150 [Polyangiaceae bacterium]|nr:hypothetical protein [Polyangiaceae bacterium]